MFGCAKEKRLLITQNRDTPYRSSWVIYFAAGCVGVTLIRCTRRANKWHTVRSGRWVHCGHVSCAGSTVYGERELTARSTVRTEVYNHIHRRCHA